MGIILLPIFIVILVAVFKSGKIGIKGIAAEISDIENKFQQYVIFMFLALLFCLAPMIIYLLFLNGKNIYSFELLIYIHVIPLLALILLANVIPKQSRKLRITRNLLFCSTIFLIPLANLAYEFALPWFNITTSI